MHFIAIFLLVLFAQSAPQQQQQFDSQGRYVGRVVTLPDKQTTQQFDKNGAYTGKAVLQPDGKTVFYFDRNGAYVGRTVNK